MPKRNSKKDDKEADALLLVTAPPGSGKTHSYLQAADEAGLRIFYSAPRHDLWNSIAMMVQTVPSTNGHSPPVSTAPVSGLLAEPGRDWQPIRGRMGPVEENGETIFEGNCVKHELVATLQGKRYDVVRNACLKVCGGFYMSKLCPYYQQFKDKKKHWFTVHGHLTHTELYDDFDLIIVDEEVYGAFADTIVIEDKDMAQVIADAPSEVARLLAIFRQAMAPTDRKETLSGRALFAELDAVSQKLYGRALADVAGAITLDAALALQYPDFTEETAKDLPMNFLGSLWDIFRHELRFYVENIENWCYRLVVERGPKQAGHARLNLLRAAPRTGKPIIALNAGGSAELYERLFRRPVDVRDAQMPLRGAVYQVITRQNNITSLSPDNANDQPWRELVAMLRFLIAEQPDSYIVSFKALIPRLQKEFPHTGMGHFGALSGSNELDREYREKVGLRPLRRIIVAGTPMPPLDTLLEEANRIFWQDGGRFIDGEWVEVERAYPGVTVYECADGVWFWTETEAQAHAATLTDPTAVSSAIRPRAAAMTVSQFADERANTVLFARREMELMQVAHRIRAVRYDDVDIWLLTNIPVPNLPPRRLLTVQELLGYRINWRLDAVEAFVETQLEAEGQVCQADALAHLENLSKAVDGKERSFSIPTARKYFQIVVQKLGLEKTGEIGQKRGHPSPVYAPKRPSQASKGATRGHNSK